MLGDQMAAVLALLGGFGGARPGALPPSGAAAAAAAALGVDGLCAGVGVGPQGVVLAWGRDPVSLALEDAQFTLGEGPSAAAAAGGGPVLVPDLAGAADRWPAFAPAALLLGVGAVFAFPLRIGVISVGAMLAHRAAPGPLARGRLTDALALADAVTVLLLHRDPAVDGPAPDGPAADRPHAPGHDGPRPGWDQPPTNRAEVHQATGMVSVQLGISLAESLVRLRAHAFAADRPIAEVAADVVARRLRLEDANP